MVVIIWYDCGMIVIITVTLYYSEILIYFYTHLISLSLLLHLQGVQQSTKVQQNLNRWPSSFHHKLFSK